MTRYILCNFLIFISFDTIFLNLSFKSFSILREGLHSAKKKNLGVFFWYFKDYSSRLNHNSWCSPEIHFLLYCGDFRWPCFNCIIFILCISLLFLDRVCDFRFTHLMFSLVGFKSCVLNMSLYCLIVINVWL